tara:strand:- start:414 stop:944 length:531 start_codon:yes stop_codon:yes gene_type:complete
MSLKLTRGDLFRVAKYFSTDHVDLGLLALAWPHVGFLKDNSPMWFFLWFDVLRKKTHITSMTIKDTVIKAEYMVFKQVYTRAKAQVNIPSKMMRRQLLLDSGVKVRWVNVMKWGYTTQHELDKLRIEWNHSRIKELQKQNLQIKKSVEKSETIITQSRINYYKKRFTSDLCVTNVH